MTSTDIIPQDPSAVAAFYDSIGPSYTSIYASAAPQLTALSTLLTYLPPGSHILDLGCGAGKPSATFLSSHGHSITGVDVSPKQVAAAAKNIPSGIFLCEDMMTYEPSQPELFDAICLHFSMLNVSYEQHRELFGKISKWVKPGGIVSVFTVLAEELVEELMGDATGEEKEREVRELRDGKVVSWLAKVENTVLTEKDWRELFERNGFEVVGRGGGVFETDRWEGEGREWRERQASFVGRKKRAWEGYVH